MPPKQTTAEFKDITFRKKEIPGLLVNKYRIYTDHTNFKLVEAENARTALEISGIQNSVRVLRDSIYLDNIVKIDDMPAAPRKEKVILEHLKTVPLCDDMTYEPPKTLEPPPQVNPPKEEQPAKEAAAPLSSEDVDKLLNN